LSSANQEIPSNVPSEIARGETVAWSKALTDYPPADGWTLTYYFRGPNPPGVNVVAETEDSHYLLVLTAAQSLKLGVGRIDWEAWVSKGAGAELEQHRVASGSIEIVTGLNTVSVGARVDQRSQAERIVASIDDLLERTLPGDTAEYEIGNHRKRHYTRAELLDIRREYQQIVNAERRRKRVAAGGDFFQTVKVRLTTVR
jgi:hypothetical protein